MSKLLKITRCNQCYFTHKEFDERCCFSREEFDERLAKYRIYCIHPGVHKKEITTPLDTIPDWCELPDTDKYRQAIENWLGYMADWHKHLISADSSNWQKPVRIAIRGMHCELERLSLPNNWKPAHEFGIKDFKLPEGS